MNFLKGYKTYLGLIMMGVGMVSTRYGFNITEGDVTGIMDNLNLALEAGGGAIAIYGRIMAGKK